MKCSKLIIVLTSIAFLQGCVAAAGVAVVGGASVATDKRTLGKQIDDQGIEFELGQKFRQHTALAEQSNLSVVSINGRVLVVGQTPTPHLRDEAIKLVNETEGVEQVHNQIRISSTTSIATRTNDTWLTTKVKTKLFGSDNIDATNVKVVTENGEVFLMGLIAKEHADEAVEITRHISGVNRVFKLFEYR
ncbi:division/outer membrane stress-associated lipid-binding lipoprotein [Thalassotalea sp. PLHSN55]|uniref:division/outer membrane stress-associated lipid-binding lipoprotein n=1 Tax=Thalassotalea sp. PLHSN55 TaxID=3435888 RepID=UPI003F840D67